MLNWPIRARALLWLCYLIVDCAHESENAQESAAAVTSVKATLHEAIFLATCNATMTSEKPFKLQRRCHTQATCLATLRKVEGRSTFIATRNATIAVAKWGVTREFFSCTLQRNVCCVASRKKNCFV